MRFYAGGRNFINKKGLFYAKFFEFEVKSYSPFFWVASSRSILCASNKNILILYSIITIKVSSYEKNRLKSKTLANINIAIRLNVRKKYFDYCQLTQTIANYLWLIYINVEYERKT
jgi:hypothetical protein